MALENAPWAVDGAKHSAAVARTLAYASTSGAEGIVEPADLRVRATQTPSGSVRVAPGAIAVLNRDPRGGQQTYTERNVSETLVDVQPTGSGGGRTDYVWAHVVDPEFTGQFPENPQTAQYFFLTASASQPEGNGWYRLARIDIPASTATITQAMITDLREVAIPRRDQVVFGRPRIVQDDPDGNPYTATELTVRNTNGGEYFPGGNGVHNRVDMFIPEWAVRMHIEATWMGVAYEGAMNSFGTYWMEFGDEYRDRTWPGNQQWEFSTQRFAFNGTRQGVGDTARDQWKLMDAVYVPKKLRGKTVAFAWKAGLATNSDQGVSMDSLGGLGLRLDFAQVADDIHTV